MKNHLGPHKWHQKSNVRMLLLSLLLLASLALLQTQSHIRLLKLYVKQSQADTHRLVENLETSILKLIMIAEEGGGVIDDYLDALNLSEGVGVRIVHSPSIDAEYGVEPEESPGLKIEKDALSDGLPHQWEGEDFYYHLTPLKAEERCRPCHHLPDGSGEAVPKDYVLGLLEIKVPTYAMKKAEQDLRRFILDTVLVLFVVVGLFLIGISRIQRELREREETLRGISASLEKNNAELKKALQDLEKAQTLLIRQEKLASVGTLAAGVAHEILNPLNIISAIVQLMQIEESTEEQKEHFKEIMNQIHRATKITNSLRMFSHQVKAQITEVDLNALFDRTVSLLEYDLNLKNILVEKKYDSSLPLVEGDEDLLAQVFMNLLTNARDAMKGGKNNRVIFCSRKVEEGVEIRLSDTGPGIPESIINRIFDPFFTTKDPNQGTGLGLSVLHSIIVEKHRGSIRVESEKGKGATFVITLPVKGEK